MPILDNEGSALKYDMRASRRPSPGSPVEPGVGRCASGASLCEPDWIRAGFPSPPRANLLREAGELDDITFRRQVVLRFVSSMTV
jgi:hypothetical protein